MAWFKRALRHSAVALRLIQKPDLVGIVVSEHPAPEAMKSGVLYIVGGVGFQKWAIFRCPRHKDEIIQLSLMPKRRPHWSVAMDFLERPTVHPSVRQLDGTYCHFWLKAGAVEWCPDTGGGLAAVRQHLVREED